MISGIDLDMSSAMAIRRPASDDVAVWNRPATADLFVDRPGDGRALWTAVLGVAAVLLLAMSWAIATDQLDQRARRQVSRELSTSLVGSVDALERWSDQASQDARFWAGDPTVRAAARELAATPEGALVASDAQADLRALQARFQDLNELLGYFVIAPDGTSLASSRDANIGTPNLIAKNFPALFDAMLAGATVLTPSQTTDVPLPTDGGLDPEAETMFVGTPIVDVDGTTLGVFTLRIDPGSTLGPILQAHATGTTGSVIVVDDLGNALTTLDGIEAGVAVTSAGGELLRPVAAVIGGTNGVDVDGYRGVDGVEEVAAWAWIDELSIGVVTEINADEAFGTSRFARTVFNWFAVTVGLLLIAVTVFPSVLARRRARERERWENHLADTHAELDESETRYRALVEPLPDVVLRIDHGLQLLDANPAALQLLGRTREELAGRPFDELGLDLNPQESLRSAVQDTLATGEGVTVRRLSRSDPTKRGCWYDARITARTTGTGDRWAYVVITDVSETVDTQRRLETQALTDSLTGLANRASAYDRLSHAMTRFDRQADGNGVAVVVVDLDRFKSLNDLHGHHVGDVALVAVSAELNELSREQDTVARLGGDEFVIIAEEVADEPAAMMIAERIGQRLADFSIDVDGRRLRVGGSVGVAFTANRMSPQELLTRADRALYRAKGSGAGYVRLYDVFESRGPFVSDTALLRDLDSALDRGEFELHYQPIVDEHRESVAVEALLRWRHPEHGLVLPPLFLQRLFETGAIVPVGHWVLREAMRTAAEWAHADSSNPAVHLNVSPSELASLGLVDVFEDAFEATGCPRDRIAIEITEEALAGVMVSQSSLVDLSRLGVELYLDDFGTGVSSLLHLRHRGLYGIKLDKSFISSIGTDDEVDPAIVAGTIAMAHDLGLVVVAEGVETEFQLEWLSDRGCRLTQGFLHSPAVPGDQLDLRRLAES